MGPESYWRGARLERIRKLRRDSERRRSASPLIIDERRQICDPIVQLASGGVEISRRSVDRRASRRIPRRVDRLNQRPPGPGAARLGVDKKVLNINYVLDPPAVAVEQLMGQADRPAALFRHQPMIILRVDEPRASCVQPFQRPIRTSHDAACQNRAV